MWTMFCNGKHARARRGATGAHRRGQSCMQPSGSPDPTKFVKINGKSCLALFIHRDGFGCLEIRIIRIRIRYNVNMDICIRIRF
jgi:hypothetical protein